MERSDQIRTTPPGSAPDETDQWDASFQAIFKQSVIGIGMLGLDGEILHANPAVCRMLGRSLEELREVNFVELIHPEDRHGGGDLFQALVRGDRDFYRADRRYLRKDGSSFWATVTVSMVYDPQGKPRFGVGMMQDVDDQRHIQEDLRQSEERFRATFESSAIGMGILGLDGQIFRVNSAICEISGYTSEELTRRVDSENVYREDREVDRELFSQLLIGERDSYQVEKRYVRKNGEVFWAKLTLSSVRELNGKPQYLIGMIEDIDAQKKDREKLAEQDAEYRRSLEKRVEERTHELTEANHRLQSEIVQRERVEKALGEKAAEEAIIAERNRLARELHDSVTQTLFSASLIAEILPDLWEINPGEALATTDELRQLTRGALAEMRTLLLELRPSAVTQARFEDLLKQLSEALIGRSRLPISLQVEGEGKLPPEVQVALYRIAQESLNNVVKHADASEVAIRACYFEQGIKLEISDNGRGFANGQGAPTSLGMRIMHERADGIGANLEVESRLGKGTCVSAIWRADETGR